MADHLPRLLDDYLQHFCDHVQRFSLYQASIQTLQSPSAQEVQAKDLSPQTKNFGLLCSTRWMQVGQD